MSYGGYQQHGGSPYGGSPYGGAEEGYAATGGQASSNPYHGTNQQAFNAPPPLTHGESGLSQGSHYSVPNAPLTHQANPLSQQDFLARIDGTKGRINQLSSNIQEIASIHQRMLSASDNRSTSQLEGIVSDTQVRNTQIKDEIKFLERDASREPQNKFKKTQVDSLKRTFKAQLEQFQADESNYSKRYRDAIARQYRIVNPDATEQEVNEAANADWGDEGIFQQALKSNRSGQATSVLGAVRARHNDIQRIERTLGELALLFQQLNETVVYQEDQVVAVEEQTVQVNKDTEQANKELSAGITSARRRRKLQWYTLLVFVIIICILALALGIYFGTGKNKK